MEDNKEIKKKKVKESVDKEAKDDIKQEPKEIIKEVIVEKKIGFNYLEVILIMIITLIIGGFLGSVINQFKDKSKPEDKQVEVSSKFQEFIDTYNDIKYNYYENLDDQELLDAGIKGMLDFLGDKYSLYMSPSESEDFDVQVEGKYSGIGTEIQQTKDKGVVITRIFDNSPASKAGLEVGDIFIKIDDNDVNSKTSAEVASMIKDSDNSKVKVIVLRGEEEKEFTIEKSVVEIESVSSEIIEYNDKKIGYIYINVFAANTYKQFSSVLNDLELSEIDRLVIDVRGNSGGYLNSVTDIVSMFLDKGKVIYQLDTKGVVQKIYDTTKTNRNYPVAVLVNKGSASASEILAGALKESYGASIIGTNSYGKGTVQRAYKLDSGATVKYTIQKWLTPDGNWLNEVGLEPTDSVELSEDYFVNPSNETDNQLQKALEVISNK